VKQRLLAMRPRLEKRRRPVIQRLPATLQVTLPPR
jgi:hypothetical protein